MTGPNQSFKRHSSIDPTQHATAATITSGFHIPFTLSPLNEFDDQYEDPLNKGMIMDQSCSQQSKHKSLQNNIDEVSDHHDNKGFSLAALLLPHMNPDDINFVTFDQGGGTAQLQYHQQSLITNNMI